jgi:antitoxin CptB
LTRMMLNPSDNSGYMEDAEDAPARPPPPGQLSDDEALGALRRKIRFRAWHRGTSEADLLLGGFVDPCIDSLTSDGLLMLDRLLEADDPIIDDWIQGRSAAPAEHDNRVLEALRQFCLASTRRGECHD